MTVLTTENRSLADALERARTFLALDSRRKSSNELYRYLREDRDTRAFFAASPIRHTTMFGVRVAEAVAHSYLACASESDEPVAPTGSQLRALQATASALEDELDCAGSWLIHDANSPAFREPLRRLKAMPSRVPPRTAGRLPLTQRRAFVLHLAQSLYALSAGFPTKLLMVATVLAWDETSDRTIREILTPEVRAAIAAQTETDRTASIESENITHQVISKASVKSVATTREYADNRPDGEKLADALGSLRTLTDGTASTVMIATLMELAQEFGIDPQLISRPEETTAA